MRATAATAEWDGAHPATQVVSEIGVGPYDLVLPRHQGVSPVHRTEVLAVLRNLGMDHVVVAGVSTNLAVLLVAVGAADEDFAVTIPTDATVGTPPEHHASVLAHSLAFVARLATTDELLAEWSGVRRHRRPPDADRLRGAGPGGRTTLRPRARRWPSSRGTARGPRCRTDARCRCPCSPRRASPRRTTCPR